MPVFVDKNEFLNNVMYVQLAHKCELNEGKQCIVIFKTMEMSNVCTSGTFTLYNWIECQSSYGQDC